MEHGVFGGIGMKTVLIVFGTRPEAIKLAPLIKELSKRDCFRVRVCATGQHKELLRDAMRAFDLCADRELEVMEKGQSLTLMGAKLLSGMEDLFSKEIPSAVLVQGDTASAFFGAIAAFQYKVPVCHVEAGLRTYRMDSPFPEELHRRAISLLSTYHFAPTEEARRCLLGEGIDPANVFLTGNTVVDALHYSLKKTPTHAFPKTWQGRRLLILTQHRRENLGEPIRAVFRALRRIVEAHDDVIAVCPLHPNPSVRGIAAEILNGVSRLHLIEPPETVSFHHLLSHAYLVITDSGGIQEEASALGIPTLVTREATERTEGVLAGVLRMVGSDEDGIVSLAERLLDPTSEEYRQMSVPSLVFGDGTASQRIADILEDKL